MKNLTVLAIICLSFLIVHSCKKESFNTELSQADGLLKISNNMFVFDDINHWESYLDLIPNLQAIEINKLIKSTPGNDDFTPISPELLDTIGGDRTYLILNNEGKIRIGEFTFEINFEKGTAEAFNHSTKETLSFAIDESLWHLFYPEKSNNNLCSPLTDGDESFSFNIPGQNLEVNGRIRYQDVLIGNNWIRLELERSVVSEEAFWSVNTFSEFDMKITWNDGYVINGNNNHSWQAGAKHRNEVTGSYSTEQFMEKELYLSRREAQAFHVSASFSYYSESFNFHYPLEIWCDCMDPEPSTIYISESGQEDWEVLNSNYEWPPQLELITVSNTISNEYDDFYQFYKESGCQNLGAVNRATRLVSQGITSTFVPQPYGLYFNKTSRVILGDFVGDSHKDQLYKGGTNWHVVDLSSGQYYLNHFSSSFEYNDIAIGDFVGDSKDDLFRADGTHWYVSESGQEDWQIVANSSYLIEDLVFADFVGDNKTDVFNANGSYWRVSDAGQNDWQFLVSSSTTKDMLGFGDFVGDEKTDVFFANGVIWQVSESGQEEWAYLATSGYKLKDLKFGNFIGDQKDDVIRSN